MAEAKSHSTKDLFLLAIGLFKLAQPGPKDPVPAELYYLKDGELRETQWNWDWLTNPSREWEQVRYRDWLIGNIAANVAGQDPNFVAVSEPIMVSMDLLTNEFKPNMKGATDAIKKIVLSKSGYERSFITALSVGLSGQKSNGKDVVVFGAGMRRRTSIWRPGVASEALQADIEFFVPFLVLPGSGSSDSSFPGARSMCAGIAISRANGSSIGLDAAKKDLAAVRFNVRVPLTAEMGAKIKTNIQELRTSFDKAIIQVHKRPMSGRDPKPAPWEKFDDWKQFVKDFCASTDGKELLIAPIGPLLLEKVDDGSSIKDLLLYKKKKREELKQVMPDVDKEMDEATELLKGLWKDWKVPEEAPKPEKIAPGSSQRKLGGLLESVGLLSGKGDKYTLADTSGLTAAQVINRMLDELDGFPLYLSGVAPKEDKGTRIAVTLASQSDEIDKNKHYFGLAGMAYNIPIKTASAKSAGAKPAGSDSPKILLDDESFTDDESKLIIDDEELENSGAPEEFPSEGAGKKSTIEIRLQLGKWFEGETLDDNWFRRLLPPAEGPQKSAWKRRTPLPGIRLLPYQRTGNEKSQTAVYSLVPRGDLLSLGFDLKGTTKDGLTFLKAKKGPLEYFGLGAVETRIALLFSTERIAFGAGIKLKHLRLSFAPKGSDAAAADETMAGLQEVLDEDWLLVPEPKKPDEMKPKTRLSAPKEDKFSISVGYLSPMSEGSRGTLDIQLYDAEDKRGKMVWIPIDRRRRGVYLKQIGIGLKGVENVDLSKGLSDDAQLTVALTGGLRTPIFELGFIGAKLAFPLSGSGDVEFSLDGLDVSLNFKSVVVSGSFLKTGLEYAGSVTIDLPKFSIGAMGFYGNVPLFSRSADHDEIVKKFHSREVHPKLLADLKKNNIPAERGSLRRRWSDRYWELTADDGKQYIITDEGEKLTVTSPDPTLFIYGMLNAASGGGVRIGPIQFTALALGFGLNRRIEVPAIEDVAEFPLVKMVMGEGGYQEKDKSDELRNQLGKPAKEPLKVLEEMKDALPPERGQYVICGGVRFTVANAVDCFGLIVAQFGNDFELAVLGLARFRHPRDLSAKPICYVEMQILMSIKPSDGIFKLQALLTSNSWIINQDCKLTGGFALFVWFAGEHKDDFVFSLGGYHPRFHRPDHYPVVPRLGLSWPVDKNLSVKGGVYLAFTPSCFMLGARLEATFYSGRVSAWFTAYLDVITAWSPFHFELDLGITLRMEIAFAFSSLKMTTGITLQMWGPPVGGKAVLDVVFISIPITFGASRDEAKPKLLDSWVQFSRTFLNPSEADKKAVKDAVPASPITQANLSAGRMNSPLPQTTQPRREDGVWKVRADQLELAAATAVPVTSLNVGRVKTSSPPEGIHERGATGQSLLVPKPVVLETAGLQTRTYGKPLGVHPMGKALTSSLNVTIVRDDGTEAKPIDLAQWTIEEEIGSLPAALWDPKKPEPHGPSEPSAKLITGCITGIKRLKPPKGELGQKASLTDLRWHRLEAGRVPRSGPAQDVPSATRARDVQAAVAGKQAEQKKIVDALSAAGFNLTWQPAQGQIRFRELRDEPLAGAVA
jgi:hypothetical protein